MSENDSHQAQPEFDRVPSIRYERRHYSQIQVPSNSLIFKKLSGSYVTVDAVRKRRTLSEQVSQYDR